MDEMRNFTSGLKGSIGSAYKRKPHGNTENSDID
jgi:hypothetical protein